MSQFRAALFDLDGTLTDTEGQYSEFWDAMAGRYGLPEEFGQQIKGSTLVSLFERYFPREEDQKYISSALYEFEGQMSFGLIPGAQAFLDDIRAHGVKTAIVTSSDRVKMAGVRSKLPDWISRFDAVLMAEDFARSKPDPSCYLLAAERLGEPLSECIVFEDAVNGLRAGFSSGIYTIGLTTTTSPEIVRPLCHHMVRDFTELSYESACELLKSRPL